MFHSLSLEVVEKPPEAHGRSNNLKQETDTIHVHIDPIHSDQYGSEDLDINRQVEQEEDKNVSSAEPTQRRRRRRRPPPPPKSNSSFMEHLRRTTLRLDEEAVQRAVDHHSQQQQKQQQQHQQQSCPTKVKLSDLEYQSLRASIISATVTRQPRQKWGFALKQKGHRVIISAMTNNGLLQHAPFQVGDTLLTVNNRKCLNEKETTKALQEMVGSITLVVQTPKGNSNLVQAVVTRPSPNSLIGIGLHNKNTANTSLLHINHLDSSGLFAYSALSQGDLVLFINMAPCSSMPAGQAANVMRNSQEPFVNIVAMKPHVLDESASNATAVAAASAANGTGPTRTQRFLRGARRGAVAVGGGTMVGIGLIFIPTLPPPFGEALIIGGVSLLGTEFEAPKRVVKSARDSLAKAIGTNDDAQDGLHQQQHPVASQDVSISVTEHSTRHHDAEQRQIDGTDEDHQEDITLENVPDVKSHKTMATRLKNIGRRYVLPFLDQVVGDKPQDMGFHGYNIHKGFLRISHHIGRLTCWHTGTGGHVDE